MSNKHLKRGLTPCGYIQDMQHAFFYLEMDFITGVGHAIDSFRIVMEGRSGILFQDLNQCFLH